MVLFYLILPSLIVVPLSFNATSYLQFPPKAWSLRWYQQFFGTHAWMEAMVTSFQVGLATMVGATALGTAAAYGMVRGRMRHQEALFAMLLAPMIFPVIIFSVALYFMFSRLTLVGSILGLVVGHTVLAVPVVFLIVSAALEGLDEMVEFAGLSAGAPPWKVFFLITVPAIRPALVTAALFAFLISFDEIVVALFMSGSTSITLPKRMWDGIRFEINPTIAAASTLLVVISGVVILAGQFLLGKVRGVRGDGGRR